MCTASPWAWCRSPKFDVAGFSPLNVSTTTTTTTTIIIVASFPSWRIRRLPSCSLQGSPSSADPPPPDETPKPLSPPTKAAAEVQIECSDDQRLVRTRRRPLWKRILFASTKVRSIILLYFVTVVYASVIPVLKEVEEIMDPALFTAVRFAISSIPFIPFVLQEHEDCQIRSAGIELGFWLSLGYLSQALGLLTSDAGRASFISAFTVIVVPLIDGLFGATMPAITWVGALVSLTGVAIMECGGSPPSVGDILNLLSAVFFGIHMLRTEHISRNTKREKVLALLGYEVCVVALSSVIWFLFKDIVADTHQPNLRDWTWSKLWGLMISFPWVPALYTGTFSTALCLWVEMDAMRNVSATETAIIYGLEPVWGAVFAWFLLGERWGTTEWIGASLVLCGSLMVQLLGSAQEISKNDEESRKTNCFISSDARKDFTLSTVVVNSKKNATDRFKKVDKF